MSHAVTRKVAARSASRVLRDPRASRDAKSATASALRQANRRDYGRGRRSR